MTELNDFATVEPVEAESDLRLPVAYSHGGFAQLRHAVANPNVNPLGPLPVPHECEAALVRDDAREPSVLFLRP